MRIIGLVAGRELGEIVKTFGFWLTIMIFPLIMAGSVLLQSFLQSTASIRYYILIDQSGRFEQVIAEEVADMEQYAAADLPAEIDATAPPADIVDALRPYLNGERRVRASASASASASARGEAETRDEAETRGETEARGEVDNRSETETRGELFALILLPVDIDDYIVRPNQQPTQEGERAGIQYWASNQTNRSLLNAVRRSVNEELRRLEYAAFGVDAGVVADVRRTYLPLSELDPSAAVGEEEVDMVDRIGQFAPIAFAYLMFVSMLVNLQFLLGNMVEEKSNRVIDTLLTTVTPVELMTGKLLGIAGAGLFTLAAWLLSFFLLSAWLLPTPDAAALESIDADFAAGASRAAAIAVRLIPWFVFYYIACYVLYSGLYLAVGSLCASQKDAQSLSAPMMFVQLVPIMIMFFVLGDPNNTVVRALSWFPFFTPYMMMIRITAPPPMIDLIGTALVLLLSIVLMLWLSGRIFRLGVLRSGQPPRLLELLQLLRRG